MVSRVIGRSIYPERFRITSPSVSIHRGTAEVHRNFSGGILNFNRQTDRQTDTHTDRHEYSVVAVDKPQL